MADTKTILAGGRILHLIFADGTTEDAKVRQLPIRLLEKYDIKQMDEPALVELYCDREEGWADKLTHESYEEIATVGDEINRSPFERLRARLVARLDFVTENRTVLEDAGAIPKRTVKAPLVAPEPLTMPEVKVVPAVAVAPAPEPEAETKVESVSKTSSDGSASADSSPPTSGH